MRLTFFQELKNFLAANTYGFRSFYAKIDTQRGAAGRHKKSYHVQKSWRNFWYKIGPIRLVLVENLMTMNAIFSHDWKKTAQRIDNFIHCVVCSQNQIHTCAAEEFCDSRGDDPHAFFHSHLVETHWYEDCQLRCTQFTRTHIQYCATHAAHAYMFLRLSELKNYRDDRPNGITVPGINCAHLTWWEELTLWMWKIAGSSGVSVVLWRHCIFRLNDI